MFGQIRVTGQQNLRGFLLALDQSEHHLFLCHKSYSKYDASVLSSLTLTLGLETTLERNRLWRSRLKTRCQVCALNSTELCYSRILNRRNAFIYFVDEKRCTFLGLLCALSIDLETLFWSFAVSCSIFNISLSLYVCVWVWVSLSSNSQRPPPPPPDLDRGRHLMFHSLAWNRAPSQCRLITTALRFFCGAIRVFFFTLVSTTFTPVRWCRLWGLWRWWWYFFSMHICFLFADQYLDNASVCIFDWLHVGRTPGPVPLHPLLHYIFHCHKHHRSAAHFRFCRLLGAAVAVAAVVKRRPQNESKAGRILDLLASIAFDARDVGGALRRPFRSRRRSPTIKRGFSNLATTASRRVGVFFTLLHSFSRRTEGLYCPEVLLLTRFSAAEWDRICAGLSSMESCVLLL